MESNGCKHDSHQHGKLAATSWKFSQTELLRSTTEPCASVLPSHTIGASTHHVIAFLRAFLARLCWARVRDFEKPVRMQQHIDHQSQFWNWLWKHSRYIYVKMCMQDIEVSFGSSETGYVNICLMVMVLNQRVAFCKRSRES